MYSLLKHNCALATPWCCNCHQREIIPLATGHFQCGRSSSLKWAMTMTRGAKPVPTRCCSSGERQRQSCYIHIHYIFTDWKLLCIPWNANSLTLQCLSHISYKLSIQHQFCDIVSNLVLFCYMSTAQDSANVKTAENINGALYYNTVDSV